MDTGDPYVYLAINPIAYTDDVSGAVIRRRLELNWFGAPAGATVQLISGSEDGQVILEIAADVAGPDPAHYLTDTQMNAVTPEDVGCGCIFCFLIL